MSAEEQTGELRARVQRLEQLVTSLETRLQQLEGASPQASPTLPLAEPSGTLAPVPAASPPADLEAHLGTYWMSRLGIVALITGIAYLITYRFGELGMLVRVVLGYVLSAGLGALGLWLSRRSLLFGRIVFGGGLALAYFVTYALHFIPSVRVIDSQVLALVLLAAFVLGIVVTAQRMHSETVAGIALFLGLHTGMLSDVTAFTLLSTTLLAMGALFFLVKNRWVIVPLSSLVSVYSTHTLWAIRAPALAPGAPDSGRLLLSLSFLALYFLLFSVALLARPRELSTRACLSFVSLNWVGLLALGAYEVQTRSAPQLFTFLLAAALAQGAGALGARWRQAPPALTHAYLVLGAITLALAMPAHFSATPLVVSWLVTGMGVGLAARALVSPALRGLSVAILLVGLAAAQLTGTRPSALFAAAFVCFLLVERLGEFRPSWLPPPERFRGHGLLQALCAGGAGLALVWLIGQEMPAGLITLGWAIAASGMFAVGFAFHERRYRLVGIAGLALALGRLLLVDLSRLPTDQRVVTFILLGVLLLLISYTYTRLKDRKA
ncbi:DUF2339 domain-containing protein [Stigmatella sp. ncwal1]|uniref:DUF2339 domain-containing protein n=1 Tax=Stigmatella ashevillensis TaxID=2995309 RepID=A0ABT5DFG0_9BACT|nr:DUF2339 domain-containing protein [Stigmatella ashevillena]MDC0712343.1 DUF2339 domain-containing protein [Stigmatella ashevillena]